MAAFGFFFVDGNNHTHMSSSRGTFQLKLKWWTIDMCEESTEPGLRRASQMSTSYESRPEATFFSTSSHRSRTLRKPRVFTPEVSQLGSWSGPSWQQGGGNFVEIRFWSSVCDLWECDGWLLPWVIWANMMRESFSHSEHWPSRPCLCYMVVM